MDVSEIKLTLAGLGCTELSDAMDRLGIRGQCFGISSLHEEFRAVGRAWTIRYGLVGEGGGSVGDFIDDVPPGDIITIDNAGRLDATVWGDILTQVASLRGIAGTVIDGICRDVNRSFELNYPIFSRGHWMRTGKDRVRVEAYGEPVAVGGVRIEQGDWIKGDIDGVIAVPASRVGDVMALASRIREAEDAIRADVMNGVGLREARAAHGYHLLQRREGEPTA